MVKFSLTRASSHINSDFTRCCYACIEVNNKLTHSCQFMSQMLGNLSLGSRLRHVVVQDDPERISYLYKKHFESSYNTIQCNATQRNATQRNATQRNATQRNATQRNATQRNATQRNATQRNATQRNATQRNATQRIATHRNPIQYNTIQYNTIQYNTIQYNIVMRSLPLFIPHYSFLMTLPPYCLMCDCIDTKSECAEW